MWTKIASGGLFLVSLSIVVVLASWAAAGRTVAQTELVTYVRVGGECRLRNGSQLSSVQDRDIKDGIGWERQVLFAPVEAEGDCKIGDWILDSTFGDGR